MLREKELARIRGLAKIGEISFVSNEKRGCEGERERERAMAGENYFFVYLIQKINNL